MNTKDQQTLFLAMAELAKVERAARVRQLAGVREWRRRKMAARVRHPPNRVSAREGGQMG